MNFDGKRTAIFLVLLLLLLCPVKAEAAEMEAYSLTYPSGEEPEYKPYCFVTPFAVNHTILRENGTQYYSGISAPQIFRLVNTQEDGGSPVAAYCADASARIRSGESYRRINLEDSSYFSDTVAGKLRAIVRQAYPQREIEDIQTAANLWLHARELPEIQELQSGEAILAAQIAIWKLTASSGYTVHALYGGVMDLTGYSGSVTSLQELNQHPTGYTAGNIESLYTYFCNLEPAAPAAVLVSDASITRTVYTCGMSPEGSYTASVTVDVSVSLGEEDALTLTAACGDQRQEQPLTGSGMYTFTFTELPERSAVNLEIKGMQYGEDVFLFDGEGERESTQTLLGWHSGKLPVSCQRTLTPIPAGASMGE